MWYVKQGTFQDESKLVHPIPPLPTKPFIQCDSHTAVTLEPQPKAGSRMRLQKGKMALGIEVNTAWSTAAMKWLYQSLFPVNLHHIRTGSSKTQVKNF